MRLLPSAHPISASYRVADVRRRIVRVWNYTMTEYRRFYIPIATWFFTVNLAERRNNALLVDKIDKLGNAFRYVKKRET